MSPRRLQRLKTFDYIGRHRYSLTFCTDWRRQLFTSELVVGSVLSQISRAAVEHDFAVIAYCFMPDHVHLLVEGLSDTSDCRRFISKSKQDSGYCYSKQFHGSLWQRYEYERVLRSEELTRTVARYILENPVRAGLVSDVRDYPFVGSLRYDFGELLVESPSA